MLHNQLFHVDPGSEHSLQKQIREQIAAAIVNGHIPLDKPLPSSRSLSSQLNVGRNTVILAYEHLLRDGYLLSRQRSGYFVNPDILVGSVAPVQNQAEDAGECSPDWQQRLKFRPSQQRNINKPRDWQKYPYPFVYGQISDDLFPLANWRECCRDSVSVQAIRGWSVDRMDNDHPLLIEDDYENEFNYQSNPLPALKSLDNNDRVIYVGSLSKTISPGLRMGYLVGPTELIDELRALRRLMLRHPAANNQHSMALFLARGYHDSLVRLLLNTYRERSQIMSEALHRYLPGSARAPGFGGSSFWVEGPPELDARELAQRAAKVGIIIEPGDIHFQSQNPPTRFFRLGFSAIETGQIEPGIELLSQLIKQPV